MATFQYKAHREDQTAVEGHVDADDLDSAMLSLKEQGLIVESIRQVEAGRAKTESPAQPSPTHAEEAERQAFQRQFSRILEEGRSLAPALFAYTQELPAGRNRRRLERIANQLEGNGHPHELEADQFDQAWIPLLSVSASSGDPSQILTGILDESQRVGDLRRKFAQALAYPLLLLGVLSAMMSLFAWFLLPAFEEMFADFDLRLHFVTKFVFGISEAIRLSRGLVILIPGLALAAIVAFLVIRPRSSLRDSITHRIPLFGSTVQLLDRADFTRCLADLMEAEVSDADALRISGRNVGYTALRQHANRLATEIDSKTEESPGSPSFRPVLPHTVTHVLHACTDPKAAAEVLRELCRMYDQQTSNRLAWISSVTSPIFIVVLGVVVGTYVVALFLPLIQLLHALTH